MEESHVAFVHYDSSIHFIYTIIFNFIPVARGWVWLAHVTSVHYAISNPFIYTIIFNFYPVARGALLNHKWQVFQISFGDTDIYINQHKY